MSAHTATLFTCWSLMMVLIGYFAGLKMSLMIVLVLILSVGVTFSVYWFWRLLGLD